MEQNGIRVLAFCGQDRCSVDRNGRIKLSPRVISDFAESGSGDVVLRCLPEGSLGIYPEDIYYQMRRSETRPAEKAAQSMLFRRTLRHFGALSSTEKISPQGRVTLSSVHREHAGIDAGGEAVVIGVEIGIEIWSPERWVEELQRVNEHMMEKGQREMAADLIGDNIRGSSDVK